MVQRLNCHCKKQKTWLIEYLQSIKDNKKKSKSYIKYIASWIRLRSFAQNLIKGKCIHWANLGRFFNMWDRNKPLVNDIKRIKTHISIHFCRICQFYMLHINGYKKYKCSFENTIKKTYKFFVKLAETLLDFLPKISPKIIVALYIYRL